MSATINENSRRPRVTLVIPEPNVYQPSPLMQHSPYIMSAGTSLPGQGQPNWPNPFMQQLYSQRAGDFVCKQFEGLNRFTKSGLSVGERSAVWMYAKFRKWSRNWFTHCFLFIVVLLYTLGGTAFYMTFEGGPEQIFLEDVRRARDNLTRIARELSSDTEISQEPERWVGEFKMELTEYEKLLYLAFKNGQFGNDGTGETWGFYNTMFFCGTIYTTIEKSMAQAVHRSQSTSRQSASCQTNSDIFTYLRRAKRSLSAPRKRDGSTDSGKMTPQMQEEKINMLERENYMLSNKTGDNDEKNGLLETNLRRFEEERRQFEKEKLKFLEDKRELDRLRLQRFERYKREIEAKRLGLKPNYDIDNPYDYMVARKVVIDYKMNDKLTASGQDSGSESEPDITVVENLPKTPSEVETEAEAEHDAKVIASEVPQSEAIKTPETETEADSSDLASPKIQLNGKELSNGTEKVATTDGDGPKSDEVELEKVEFDEKNPMKFWPFVRILLRETRQVWSSHRRLYTAEWRCIKSDINKCLSELVMLMMFCGMGGLMFRYIEGNYEMMNKTGVKRVKRDFIDHLWLSSHNLREDDWKSMARTRLRMFEEELQTAIESGMRSYSGHTTWNFVNGVLYCVDICTTIGYGHISPVTTAGRIFTIFYAIFGIPIFLILLADFGKLFTRVIKFLWVFVRRLYYTGSCRKVRKTVPAQDVMRGLGVMYDFVRRPSMAFDPRVEQMNAASPTLSIPPPNESPMTPMSGPLETYEIDDEFNLPISVAITLLVIYMLFGATIYWIWQEWSFFESLYFVFISISTIGFGDFVPGHPLYMLFSIVYFIFGLALTSMCINVVQLKLSDHFKQASSKIIGLQMAEAASQGSAPQSPTEMQSVHSTNSIDNNGATRPTNDTSMAGKGTANTNLKLL